MAQVPNTYTHRHPSRHIVRLAMSLFAAAFLLLTVGTLQVSAQTTYTLSVPNSAVSGYPAPYGTAVVTLNTSTTATVVFTTNLSGAHAYLMAGVSAADVNVNATTFSISNITGSNSLSATFTPGAFSSGGSGNVDGFGTLNQTVNDFDGFTHSATTISFTLTNTSGTWANSGNVLVANNDGALAAIHLFVCNNAAATCTASSGAIATGFAANGGATSVPEPVSMLLFGSGLVAIGAKLRRRNSRNLVAAA